MGAFRNDVEAWSFELLWSFFSLKVFLYLKDFGGKSDKLREPLNEPHNFIILYTHISMNRPGHIWVAKLITILTIANIIPCRRRTKIFCDSWDLKSSSETESDHGKRFWEDKYCGPFDLYFENILKPNEDLFSAERFGIFFSFLTCGR